MNGCEIIECITNTPTQMPIRIIRSVVSSSRTWDGWCCASIRMSRRKVQIFRWPIWNKMRSLCSRRSEKRFSFVNPSYLQEFIQIFVFQALCPVDANVCFHHTNTDSVSFCGRTILVFAVHCWSLALHDDIAFHMACEQCRTYLGNETVRPVS